MLGCASYDIAYVEVVKQESFELQTIFFAEPCVRRDGRQAAVLLQETDGVVDAICKIVGTLVHLKVTAANESRLLLLEFFV